MLGVDDLSPDLARILESMDLARVTLQIAHSWRDEFDEDLEIIIHPEL